MALNTLKPREVLAAKAGVLSDGGGLSLRIGETGSSWVLRYTAPTGRRREMGLGPALRDTLAQAGDSLAKVRKAAQQARDLLDSGIDPLDALAERKQAARQAEAALKAVKARDHWTLARCARDYHERAIEQTKTAKHAAQWISSLENHVPPAIWNKPIGEIKPPELLAALLGVKPHERARNLKGKYLHETVMRVRQRLDTVFEDAIFHERCSTNPAAAIRRKMRESTPRKRSGQFAALPYREAPALMARLRAQEGIAARALEFTVLTAARTNEVIGAVWSEFDLGTATWLVPAERMKASGKVEPEPHLVHLSPRAAEILAAMRDSRLDARLVFPSPRSTDDKPKSLSNMAMLTLLGRMGMRDRTTVHGLCRATFSTWAYETAAARPDVIEACLAHREADKVKAAYNRAQFNDERRALLVAWSIYLAKPTIALAA